MREVRKITAGDQIDEKKNDGDEGVVSELSTEGREYCDQVRSLSRGVRRRE